MFLHKSRLALIGSLVVGMAISALPAQVRLTPTEAQEALKLGNRRFVENRSLPKPLGEGIRRSLAEGQSPYAIVVTCSDSRVAPEHIFNAGLGEVFTIRVTGNVCDPETLASIEYAAVHLETPICVVLSHDHCQAIEIAANGPGQTPALQAVGERLAPALHRAAREGVKGRELLNTAERENAHETICEALRRSPQLRDLSRAGRFQFAAARYKVGSGEVEWLPDRTFSLDEKTKPLHESRIEVVHGAPPHVSLSMLQAGYRRYMAETGNKQDISQERRKALVEGERPLAIVVTCADSRVVPDHIFDTGLGELHVVRVAGNALNNEVLASLETAVHYTGASLILVLGHDDCGAVTAAIDHAHDPNLSPSMRSLVDRLSPAVAQAQRVHKAKDRVLRLAVERNVQRFLGQARAQSKLLLKAEDEGHIAMLGAVYSLKTGNLRWLREDLAAAAPMGETHQAGHDDHGDAHAPAGHDAHGNAHAPAGHDAHGNSHAPAGHDAHGDSHGSHGGDTHGDPEYDEYAHEELDEAYATEITDRRGESILSTLIIALIVSICGVGMLVFWQRRMEVQCEATAVASETTAETASAPAEDSKKSET